LAKLTLIREGLPGNRATVANMLLIKGKSVEVPSELALAYIGSNEFDVEFQAGELDSVNDASFRGILSVTKCKNADEVRNKFAPAKKTIIKTVTETVTEVVAPKPKKEVKVDEEKSSEESSDEAKLADESE